MNLLAETKRKGEFKTETHAGDQIKLKLAAEMGTAEITAPLEPYRISLRGSGVSIGQGERSRTPVEPWAGARKPFR